MRKAKEGDSGSLGTPYLCSSARSASPRVPRTWSRALPPQRPWAQETLSAPTLPLAVRGLVRAA